MTSRRWRDLNDDEEEAKRVSCQGSNNILSKDDIHGRHEEGDDELREEQCRQGWYVEK